MAEWGGAECGNTRQVTLLSQRTRRREADFWKRGSKKKLLHSRSTQGAHQKVFLAWSFLFEYFYQMFCVNLNIWCSNSRCSRTVRYIQSTSLSKFRFISRSWQWCSLCDETWRTVFPIDNAAEIDTSSSQSVLKSANFYVLLEKGITTSKRRTQVVTKNCIAKQLWSC